MKNVFAIDFTKNSANTVIDGDALITDRLSDAEMSEYFGAVEKLARARERAELPLWMRIIKYIAGLIALIIVLSIAKAMADSGTTLEEAYSNAGYIFYIGAAGILIFGVLEISSRIKKSKVQKSDDLQKASEGLVEKEAYIKKRFRVPDSAIISDVFEYKHKNRHGKESPVSFMLGTFKYNNIEKYVYVREGRLFFTDESGEISFPLSDVTGIRKINKRIAFPNWNKSELPSGDEYKKYKVSVNTGSYVATQISVKPYYALEIMSGAGAWEIWLPSYEAEKIAALASVALE